jgi:Glucodextranase, domain B
MMRTRNTRVTAALASVLAVALAGCGSSTTTTTTTTSATSTAASGVVRVVVTSPVSGSVIAAARVVVRGTVAPPKATVLIQGQPAAVGNGVFTGTATLQPGKNTIDVIGSAPGATPGSTSVVIVRQSSNSPKPRPSSPPSSRSRGATPGIAHESNLTSCGGGLFVGPNTTCVFAQAVQAAYEESGGSSSVEAYSPVTQKYYAMNCETGQSQVVCRGGIGASVYFPS